MLLPNGRIDMHLPRKQHVFRYFLKQFFCGSTKPITLRALSTRQWLVKESVLVTSVITSRRWGTSNQSKVFVTYLAQPQAEFGSPSEARDLPNSHALCRLMFAYTHPRVAMSMPIDKLRSVRYNSAKDSKARFAIHCAQAINENWV